MEIIDFGLLIVRFFLGTFFIAHGYSILADKKDMTKWLSIIGYKPGIFWTWVLIIAEFYGGLFVLFGLGTRLFASGMTVVLALGILHRKSVKRLNFVEGWELNYMALASTILLILVGAGRISLDYFFGIA
ncbi:DoxX family protein [Candidatus Woesearchaeota archaeon]|nr:DoxX family protein [Candidatus Woesearchaeota archaeon]